MARIEQTVEMHDEISHVGVIYGLLRLRLPGRMSRRVIRKYPDDFDLIEILEGRVLQIGEFAPDDEMKQLLRRMIRHVFSPSVPAISNGNAPLQ